MRARTVTAVVVAVGCVAFAAYGAGRAPGQRAQAVDVDNEPVIAAVGDMACDPSDPPFNGGAGTSKRCAEQATSDRMLADTSIDALLGLGDVQYDCGDLADYAVSYTPTWGRENAIIHPVAGNHEYKTGKDSYGATCPSDNTTAQNFFNYFGAAAHPETDGHFSFDLGTWHLIGLNANCKKRNVGGCTSASAQTSWLKQDLAATTQPCVLAFWHQPYLTGRASKPNSNYASWWSQLYKAGADVVLNGHVHNYQRFAPSNDQGQPASDGITEYVVGTGGEGLMTVSSSAQPQPVTWDKSFGYLTMTLHADGWDAQFVAPDGTVLDSSSGTCH